MGLFDKIKNTITQADVESEQYSYNLAGCFASKEEVEKILVENPVYKRSLSQLIKTNQTKRDIYKYYSRHARAKLVAEPKNEHDPNAIYVTIDGHKVGYIPKSFTGEVKEHMKRGCVTTAFVCGGNMKRVVEVNDDRYDVVEEEHDYFSSVIIEIKKTLF